MPPKRAKPTLDPAADPFDPDASSDSELVATPRPKRKPSITKTEPIPAPSSRLVNTYLSRPASSTAKQAMAAPKPAPKPKSTARSRSYTDSDSGDDGDENGDEEEKAKEAATAKRGRKTAGVAGTVEVKENAAKGKGKVGMTKVAAKKVHEKEQGDAKMTKGKAKKDDVGLDVKTFMKKAENVSITFGDEDEDMSFTMQAEPKESGTGSFGWHATGARALRIGGERTEEVDVTSEHQHQRLQTQGGFERDQTHRKAHFGEGLLDQAAASKLSALKAPSSKAAASKRPNGGTNGSTAKGKATGLAAKGRKRKVVELESEDGSGGENEVEETVEMGESESQDGDSV